MSYEKMTIKQVIEKIGNNEFYLPAIQRKFVWRQDQIEKLFDSIQQGYPIGTFLFWFVKRPHIDNYVFYKFLQKYHQRDKYLNDRIPNPELKDEIIGVLDGQQRLSAIYLSLQGTFAVKKPYYEWSNDAAFPERKLHLNLLSMIHEEEDLETDFTFQFITDEEAKEVKSNQLWFSVRDVLTWDKDSPPIDDIYDVLSGSYNDMPEVSEKLADSKSRSWIKRTLRDLHSRLVREELINFFKVELQELDDIVKVFVRVNSGGTILSKTDLLFSTIIANWENGRDEIESFIVSTNKKGDGFSFSNDFVMRCCLMLTDCPVLFKVGSFKTENVTKIKNSWNQIKNAISSCVDLLVEFGLSAATLTSQNALIPICYYIFKGGIIDTDAKLNIRKFLFHALLKNIFSAQGDSVLNTLRNGLRDEKDPHFKLTMTRFSFDKIAALKFPANRSLRVADEDIDEFLEYRKGASAFLVLSLLYPNLRFGQVKFHQDHIHPDSFFTASKLKQLNIPEPSIKAFVGLKDRVPNLQLLEGIENIRKSNTPFKIWLNGIDEKGSKNVKDPIKFLEDNFIDTAENLDFTNFLSFFDNRKKKIKTELVKILK